MAKLLPHATTGSIRTFSPGLVDRKLSPSRRMVRIGLMRFHQVCVYYCGTARSVNVNRPPKKRVGGIAFESVRDTHTARFISPELHSSSCSEGDFRWSDLQNCSFARFLRERCFRFDKRRKEAISTVPSSVLGLILPSVFRSNASRWWVKCWDTQCVYVHNGVVPTADQLEANATAPLYVPWQPAVFEDCEQFSWIAPPEAPVSLR